MGASNDLATVTITFVPNTFKNSAVKKNKCQSSKKVANEQMTQARFKFFLFETTHTFY